MEKLLIIDGNNLLFQMFYGLPKVVEKTSGRPIHGTIGFISFVIKEIKVTGATKALVVFDKDGAEDRIREFPQYKAQREDDWDNMEEDQVPFSQEEDIRKALDYMEIKYVYSEGSEADDLIYSVAEEAKKEAEVVISSFDSDFFQLIDDGVSVLRFRGKASVLWNKEKFYGEFSFSPSSYVLYKAILGDSADNIPGVSGIGKKRAGVIVRHYEEHKRVDDAPLSDRLRRSLMDNWDTVERNMRLIRLIRMENIPSISGLSFNLSRVEEGNSRVLHAAGVFHS